MVARHFSTPTKFRKWKQFIIIHKIPHHSSKNEVVYVAGRRMTIKGAEHLYLGRKR